MKTKLLAFVMVAAIAAPGFAADDDLFNSLSYRLVGPFRGGRVTAVTGVPGEPMTYYMGSTGGGVWKTTDAGKSWRNVSDAVRELEPTDEPEVMGDVDPALAGVKARLSAELDRWMDAQGDPGAALDTHEALEAARRGAGLPARDEK